MATIQKTAAKKTATTAAKAAQKPRVTRTAPKAAAKQTTAAKHVLTVASIKFLTTNRPGSGNGLASYTAAWQAITGFDNGAILPRATLLKLAGDTAVKYHLNKGNFEEVSTGMRITEQGKLHFAGKSNDSVSNNRNIRPILEYVEAYKAFFQDGKLNDSIGIKNASFVKAVSF